MTSAWRWVIPVMCLGLAQCELPDGRSVGTFQVTGRMMTNTCGAQTGLFDAQFRFPVELTVRQGVLQWKPVGVNAEGASGAWRDGAFRLELLNETVIAPSNRRTGFPGCVLVRHDVIEAQTDAQDAPTLDGGVRATDPAAQVQFQRFQGTETIVLGGANSSDCSGLIGASSGQVNALPCTVTYQLRGELPADAGN